MSRQQELVKNTAILALGKTSSKLVGFLLLPLYTYYLNPSEYGFVDLALVYLSLLVPALTLQLEMASFRFLVDARSSEKERVRVVSNIVYTTGALALPWAAIFMAFSIIAEFEHGLTILLAGVSMLCANILLQTTRGLGDNKQFAVASILAGLVTLLGAVVFIVFMGMRIDGILLSVAVANIVAAIYLMLQQKLYRYIKLGQSDKVLQREILGYSTPLVPNSVAWWVINALDRTIITVMISVAANGVYAVSAKYSAILQSIAGVFNLAWSESASLHINSPDRDKFFSQVAGASVRLFGSLGLGLVACVPFIFPIMVDAQFQEAYLYIPIMVLAVFFNFLVTIYSAVYIAKKLTKKVMNTSIVAAILSITLTLTLIPVFGLYAAAGAMALSYLAMAIYRHRDVQKYVKITYEKNIFYALAALFVAVCYLYYLNTVWSELTALAVAVFAAYGLNRNSLGRIKNMLLKK